ncbi:hypothetical protein HKBW3S33_01616 [Candidatus Hakubella thermalkaliphila]|uniref:Uncharacterized protein n=1 Tax=Candidatus Hakubella thermalkaliphila TaxID=2754717 RepID=A0A6V8P830_9ACTN|nr:hypothetical protein HKBW3S33_01616 [Candidatus Hakubella thermalkaliphila]
MGMGSAKKERNERGLSRHLFHTTFRRPSRHLVLYRAGLRVAKSELASGPLAKCLKILATNWPQMGSK